MFVANINNIQSSLWLECFYYFLCAGFLDEAWKIVGTPHTLTTHTGVFSEHMKIQTLWVVDQYSTSAACLKALMCVFLNAYKLLPGNAWLLGFYKVIFH